MRKVKLDIDGLAVESFETSPVGNELGTVRAREQATSTTCYQGYSCPALSCLTQCAEKCVDWSNEGCGFETSENTCGSAPTCAETCPHTCNCGATVSPHTCPQTCDP
ncbi:MAG TPA: hypothetical protein VFQ45_19970 [Longimicrobium sp.]|nr:hypothetical protein [Longimicrobium sp.]